MLVMHEKTVYNTHEMHTSFQPERGASYSKVSEEPAFRTNVQSNNGSSGTELGVALES